MTRLGRWAFALLLLMAQPAWAVIDVNTSFSPINVLVNQTSNLAITVLNSVAAAGNNLTFADTLPSGVTAQSVVSNTCGGTVSISPSTQVSLSGGTVPAASSGSGTCALTVRTLGATAGTKVNTLAVGSVTTSNQGSNPTAANATLTVQTPQAVTGTKTFSATSVHGGGTRTFTVTLTNPNASPLANASFTDTLPTQLAIATTPAASTTCTGGTLSDPAGGALGGGDTGIRLSGGTIAANGSCTVTVTIMPSNASAPYNANVVNSIPIGGVTTTEGASNTAAITSANHSVQTGGEVNLVFAPTSIAANGVTYSTLTLRLRNRNLTAVSGAALSTSLPTNLVIASPNGLTTTNCGTPTITATPGTTSINITGATIAAATTTSANYGECVIAVRVVANSTTGSPFSYQVPAGSYGAGLPSYSASVATLTATTPAITAIKSFSPATVGPGATSMLTITLQNSKASAATIVSFTDNLTSMGATGYTIAASPAASTTCGGTLNAAPGATLITMTTGTIPAATSAQGTCTITVPVQVGGSVTLGTKTNTIAANAIQTSQGNNASAVTTTLKVSAPTVAKTVSSATIVQGQTTTFTITLTNPASTPATITSFADNLTTMDASGRVTVAPTPAASTTCGGTLNAAPGATSVSLSGGSIPASSSCTITVPIQPAPSIPTGSKTNTIAAGALQTNVGNNAAAATRAVTVNTGMTCTKAFSPASVGPGSVTRATVTVTHVANAQPYTGLAFSDNLPAGMTVAPTPNVASTCGGTVTATPGASSFGLSGGAIPGTAAASCTVSIDLVAPSSSVTNTINAAQFTTTQGYTCSANAAATLTVNAAPNVTLNKSFAPNVLNGGAASQLQIDIINNATGATALSSVALTDVFPTGMVVHGTPGATFTGTGCSGGTITANPGDGQVSLSGASVGAGKTCSLKVNVTSFQNGNRTNDIPVSTLTSAQGATNSNSPSATLTVQGNLNIVKFFDPATIAAGSTSILHVRIVNSSGSSRTGATPALTDNLPAGLTVATGATTNTCSGGTLSDGGGGALNAGDNAIRLSGGTIPASGFCEFSVPVSAAVAGDYVNTLPANALSTLQGSTNPDAATATLKAVAKPTIVKAFAPASIGQGGTSTVTFTLTNPNSSTLLPGGLTGAAFTDTLTNMSIDTPGPAGGTCVGADSDEFTAGDTSLNFAGLTIPPAASCTVTIPVTSEVVGLHPNQTSGVLTSQTQSAGAASASVSLRVLALPTISKAFGPATTPLGQASTLTITLSNPNSGTSITGAGFTDVFPVSPDDMTLSNTTTTNTCGGTLRDSGNSALNVGDVGIRLTGGTIPAGGSCTITVSVVASTLGAYANTIAAGGLTTTNAGANAAAANATLTVNAVPLTAIKEVETYSDPVDGTTNPKAIPGALVDYTITVTNPGLVPVDDNTVFLTDAVPSNANLFVGHLNGSSSGPVSFTDGSPASGLSYTYGSLGATNDDVSFSSNGGADGFAYNPTPNAAGVDASVTHIRVNPKGAFDANTSFQLTFRVQVK